MDILDYALAFVVGWILGWYLPLIISIPLSVISGMAIGYLSSQFKKKYGVK